MLLLSCEKRGIITLGILKAAARLYKTQEIIIYLNLKKSS